VQSTAVVSRLTRPSKRNKIRMGSWRRTEWMARHTHRRDNSAVRVFTLFARCCWGLLLNCNPVYVSNACIPSDKESTSWCWGKQILHSHPEMVGYSGPLCHPPVKRVRDKSETMKRGGKTIYRWGIMSKKSTTNSPLGRGRKPAVL